MSKPVEAPIKRKERPKTKVDIENNIIDWTTFYRRNIHRFIADYLKLSLFPYQILLVYLMSLSPLVVVVCSRASAKSYTTTVFAVATCILYPNSKVVVTAMTKFLVSHREIHGKKYSVNLWKAKCFYLQIF